MWNSLNAFKVCPVSSSQPCSNGFFLLSIIKPTVVNGVKTNPPPCLCSRLTVSLRVVFIMSVSETMRVKQQWQEDFPATNFTFVFSVLESLLRDQVTDLAIEKHPISLPWEALGSSCISAVKRLAESEQWSLQNPSCCSCLQPHHQ